MNFWISDGTVDFNNFKNYIDTVVNEIHDIIYDLLKNKASTVNLRKKLLDIDLFSSLYDKNNYKPDYKPFIYYSLRKYSILTNFYLPEAQTNENIEAVSPFEAATSVILEIDELGLKNVTKNRGFDLLVHLAAIDAAHKYIIEKTAYDINLTEKTELNKIIDELLGKDKNLFVKYKDIYIKYFQFLVQDNVELFGNIYKTDQEGFVKFLNFVYEAEFNKEDAYFLKINDKLYIANDKGIKTEVKDDFVKVDLNLLPENVLIPSPYFYVYLNLNEKLFTILEQLLFTFIDDDNTYPIVINTITYNLTPQEMLQVFILTVYKSIIELLYGIKPVFRKLSNIDTRFIELYKTIKDDKSKEVHADCFKEFRNCILKQTCSETLNSSTYYAGKFNREISGLIQIIVNSSSDTLMHIYNSSTIDDAKNIAFYLVRLFNYLCEEDIDVSYFNKYSKNTIQKLATYLVDLPYRLILYLIVQRINLQKDYFVYSENKYTLNSIFKIRDYYYNISDYGITNNTVDLSCTTKNVAMVITNGSLSFINLNNNYGLNSKNPIIKKDSNHYCNTITDNINLLANTKTEQHITNSKVYKYIIDDIFNTTFYSTQEYIIKTNNDMPQLCNLCTIYNTYVNVTYKNSCYDVYSIENKSLNTKLYIENSITQYSRYNLNNLTSCNNAINLTNDITIAKIYMQNDM